MSALKITILGCGSSFGVPLFHNIWGKCDPNEPKNRRTRPSILVQKNGKNLLIDTSPDLKQQFLSNKIDNIVFGILSDYGYMYYGELAKWTFPARETQ